MLLPRLGIRNLPGAVAQYTASPFTRHGSERISPDGLVRSVGLAVEAVK
jgi:hypothetical protein